MLGVFAYGQSLGVGIEATLSWPAETAHEQGHLACR
jgi:hypothetical protein